jgi:hypothetical protein
LLLLTLKPFHFEFAAKHRKLPVESQESNGKRKILALDEFSIQPSRGAIIRVVTADKPDEVH